MSETTLDLAALSGVEQLRLAMSGEGEIAPIAQTVGFTLTEVEEGRVAFEAPAAEIILTAHRELEKLVLSGAFDSLYGIRRYSPVRRPDQVTRRDLLLALADLRRMDIVESRTRLDAPALAVTR